MTDFYMRVDRPENRLSYRFLDSDNDGAQTLVTISIPKREWMPEGIQDKITNFVEKNPQQSIDELTLFIIGEFDPEGYKWLKANRKKIPQEALGTIFKELGNQGMSEGELTASSTT